MIGGQFPGNSQVGGFGANPHFSLGGAQHSLYPEDSKQSAARC